MKSNKGRINVRVQNARGITLLALAVTIVVLLILTSIGIKLALGDNGIIGEAKNAKVLAEIDEEKGIVKRATTVSLIKSKGLKVEQDALEKALDDEAGEGRTDVSDAGDVFEILFTDTNRYYEVDEEGNISDANKIIKDEYAGDITKGGRCDGSEEKPYEISCIEDLVVFSNMTNGTGIKFENGQAVAITGNKRFDNENVILTRNLNFKSKYSYDNYERTDFGDINGDDTDGNMLMTEMITGSGFIPIGSYDKAFCGNFDGKNHEITNIFECADISLGLFGYIRNVNIQNIYVSGEISRNDLEKQDTLYSVAGIAGCGYEVCNIRNCVSNVNITANNYGVAGIIGRGYSTSWTILNCANLGKIENKTEGTAGIIGRPENSAYVYNCYNLGEIGTSKGYVGGIVGDIINEECIISNVYNVGSIKHDGAYGAGGIIGTTRSSVNVNVSSAYSIGKILGKSTYLGAICGSLKDTSTVNITGSKYKKGVCSKIIGNSDTLEYEGVTGVDELTGNELVENLNANATKHSDWKKWRLGSDGYPTFID